MNEKSLMNISLPNFILTEMKDPKVSNQDAIVDGSSKDRKSLRFGDIVRSTYVFANYMKKLRIKHKDAVAILSPNHSHYLTIFNAIGLVGAYSTPINPLATENEIEYQIEATQAKLMIVHHDCIPNALKVSQILKIPIIVIDNHNNEYKNEVNVIDSLDNILRRGLANYSNIQTEEGTFYAEQLNFDATNELISVPFSSGTTGKSKGVMLTHRNLTTNIIQWLISEGNKLELNPSTGQRGVLLIPLPFFHIYALTLGLCAPMYAKCKLVFMSSFDLPKYLENIEYHKVTRSYVAPPIVLQLAKNPTVAKYDLSSLQCLMSAAAPLGPDIQELCASRLNCIVKQGWGMTELSPIG